MPPLETTTAPIITTTEDDNIFGFTDLVETTTASSEEIFEEETTEVVGKCDVVCAEVRRAQWPSQQYLSSIFQIFMPVCGSNGETYNNTCLLKLESCLKNTNIQVDYEGDCSNSVELELNPAATTTEDPWLDEGSSYEELWPATETDCSLKCDGVERDPVCGDDGITYDNLCQEGFWQTPEITIYYFIF